MDTLLHFLQSISVLVWFIAAGVAYTMIGNLVVWRILVQKGVAVELVRSGRNPFYLLMICSKSSEIGKCVTLFALSVTVVNLSWLLALAYFAINDILSR
ncbi:MAG: hypothetical protein ACI9HK_004754 [Pirellulaceae bacterium]|jgi:hypothetical protein